MERLSIFSLLFLFAKTSFGNQNCGRCPLLQTYSSNENEGVIKSPGNPDNTYCDNLDCTFVLKQGKPGTGIKITFESFETEAGNDWLEIYYVSESFKQNLTRLTGTYDVSNLPNYVFGDDASLEFVFKTDGSFQQKGFFARFRRFNVSDEQCVCPGFLHSASAQENVLTSPNYPQAYCHNMQCYYLIRANPGYSIRLKIDDFETEDRFDYLEIFDGPNSDPNSILARLNGSLSKEQEDVHTSLKNQMLLVFRSDGDTSHRGFRARFKAVEGLCTCLNQTLTEDSGNFTSLGFPKYYCPDINCTTRIRVRSGKRLQIQIPYYRLMRFQDTLEVLSPDPENFLFLSYKSSGRNRVFTAPGNEILIRHSTHADEGRRMESRDAPTYIYGWNATYVGLNLSPGCSCGSQNPKTLSDVTGLISARACGPMDCYYVLSRPGPNMTILNIFPKKMTLEPGPPLPNSERMGAEVQIYRQSEDHPVMIQEYHGEYTKSENTTFEADGPPIVIHFHSPNASDSNFEIVFEWHSQNCTCDSRAQVSVSETPSLLTSPGFPIPYCNRLTCGYRLTARPGQRVVVNVTDFRTEFADPLVFYETNERGETLASLNGSLTGTTLLKSSGNVMWLKFYTDGSVTYRGWKLFHFSEEAENVPPATTTLATVPQTLPPYQTPAAPQQIVLQIDEEQRNLTKTLLSHLTQSMQNTPSNANGSGNGLAFGLGISVGLLVGIIAVLLILFRNSITNRLCGGIRSKRFDNAVRFENKSSTPDYIVNDAYEGFSNHHRPESSNSATRHQESPSL